MIDPRQYTIDGGWDWDAIVTTATYGLASEDADRIEAWHSRGNGGVDYTAAIADQQAIYQYCVDRVREEQNS